MNWIDFEKKSLKMSIKFNKNALKAYFAVFILNLIGVIIYFHALYFDFGSRAINGYAIGVFLIGSLWTLFFCYLTWCDLKDDAKNLSLIAGIELNSKLDLEEKMIRLKEPNCT